MQIKDNIKSEEIELLQCIFDSAVQQLLNVYDDACGLYIDKKLDKTHFIKNYETEIINLVEAECYYEYYYGKYSKFYEKTLNVYKLIKPLKK